MDRRNVGQYHEGQSTSHKALPPFHLASESLAWYRVVHLGAQKSVTRKSIVGCLLLHVFPSFQGVCEACGTFPAVLVGLLREEVGSK